MSIETDAIIRREMQALAETLENSFYGLDRLAILEKIERRMIASVSMDMLGR